MRLGVRITRAAMRNRSGTWAAPLFERADTGLRVYDVCTRAHAGTQCMSRSQRWFVMSSWLVCMLLTVCCRLTNQPPTTGGSNVAHTLARTRTHYAARVCARSPLCLCTQI